MRHYQPDSNPLHLQFHPDPHHRFWLGKIINLEKTDASQDYQCYTRILHVICYYELGYFDSLEYALKSAYHFLSKRQRAYKYENIVLTYLRKSFRIKTQTELIEMFKEMKRYGRNLQ